MRALDLKATVFYPQNQRPRQAQSTQTLGDGRDPVLQFRAND